MQRFFLNWNVPLLDAAAEYLARRYSLDGRIDMRKVLIAVPGSRAKRRLEELLQQKAASVDPAWFPPNRITTMGTFPELLYPQKRPAASDLVQQLAWSRAFERLNKTNAGQLKNLLPQLPDLHDWSGRMTLGRLVAQLHLELAADMVDFTMMADHCRQKNLEGEALRWHTLADLQQLYIEELDALQLWDIQAARAYAIKENECKTEYDVVLIGLVDLNRTQRAILDAIESNVTSLVFAPETLADHFDKYGCVDTQKWNERHLEVPDELIEMADTPSTQATAVLHWLQQLNAEYSADEIVIGVPDANVAPFLLQQLEQANLNHRLIAGTPVTQTSVFLLLETLANYLQNRRFYDLATFVRHPDVERYLFEQLRNDVVLKNNVPDWRTWVTEFDTYYQGHLPMAVDGHWLLRHRRETDDDSELDVLQKAATPSRIAHNGTRHSQRVTLTESVLPPETANQLQQVNDPTATREYYLLQAVYNEIEQLLHVLFVDQTDQTSDAISDKASDTTNDKSDDKTVRSTFEKKALQKTSQKMLFDLVDESGAVDEIDAFEAQNCRLPEAFFAMRKLPHDWVESIDRFLQSFYKNRNYVATQLSDHTVTKSLETLNLLYEQIINVPRSIAPSITITETLTLLLRMWSSERIPPMPGDDAIELLGWLELLTDDAPALAITGLNEGVVPSSKSSDIFLPDTLRRELQLEDNRRRYARDAYALSAIIALRKNVRLIFGKRSVEGDPLVPSRFFFATDEETIAKRVKSFFSSKLSNTVKPFFSGALRAGQKKSTFEVPMPLPLNQPLRHIRVTEFRDYLQCRYRYYLKHKLRLISLDDVAEELDGGAFGDVAHRVLKLFGKSKLKDSHDAEQIRDYLSRQLDAVVFDLYGTSYRPVIAVQVEQIRLRLCAFAETQAKWAAEGHEILHVEYSPNQYGGVTVDVDGIPVMIRGRIDRIDFDHGTGKYVLLDYKTGATSDEPDKVHRKKGEWVDLQLPLYRTLFCDNRDDDIDVDLGYISLPKDATQTKFLLAKWHTLDLMEAEKAAHDVIRNIRREVFWPPKEPPPAYSEIFSPICLDRQLRFYDDAQDVTEDAQ